MRFWWKRPDRDFEGIEESRRVLAEAHAETAEVQELAARLRAKRKANNFGPRIHAALQGGQSS